MSTKINFEHEAQQKEETYKIGDWFMDDGSLCQLVQTDRYMVNLIVAGNGNRVDKAIKVENVTSVGKQVINNLTRGREWQRVSVEITTKPYKP